jgi:hypothetical protein
MRGWDDDFARRDVTEHHRAQRWRQRSARTVLTAGALLQLLLILGLPIGQMDSSELESFLCLAALFVCSIAGAVLLARRARQAIAIIVFGVTLNAIMLIRWIERIFPIFSVGYASVNVTVGWSYLISFVALATLPIAFALAWPLRRGAPAAELHTDVTEGS